MGDVSKIIEGLSPKQRELFSLLLEESRNKKGTSRAQGIPRREESGSSPLSFSQQRLWFFDQMEPGSPAYNVPGAIRLKGLLNATALEKSLNEVVRRHEILRTTFSSVDGQPIQVISPALTLTLPVVNLGEAPEAEREGQAHELLAGETRRGFDLSAGPLLRTLLIRIDDDDHILSVNMHHIVSDGWSIGIFIREMAALYETFSAGRPSPLAELPIQYADFARWQRERLQGEGLESEIAYWKQQLAGAASTLELPIDRPRPAIQTRLREHALLTLSNDLADGLKALSRREGATLFMTLLAIFKILLCRYTNQKDIVVGTPIANRNRVETHDLIGFFVNTLVLRTELSDNPAFIEALARVRKVALGAYAHQDLPLEKLVEELQPSRDMSRPPLFQVMFILRNEDVPPLKIAGLTISPIDVDNGAVNFDLILNAEETGEGLTLLMEYNPELFNASTINRMLGHLVRLTAAAVSSPDTRIFSLPMLTQAERKHLLEDFNQTAVALPSPSLLHALFEAQVLRSPHSTAVLFDEHHLSYSLLNHKANQLAHFLLSLDLGTEARVGVCLPRGLDLPVALLGVLKAGGAYLPLDPSYPRQRLTSMLEDAGVEVVLTLHSLRHLIPPHLRAVCLDLQQEETSTQSGHDPALELCDDSLAYVIFTSGSTGRPKGAMNTHRAICNRLLWMQAEYKLKQADRVLQKTPVSFDVSVWELFWPLISGAVLVMARPGVHQDSKELIEVIRREQVSVMHFVPAMMQAVLEEEGVERCESLRVVISSGEELKEEVEKRYWGKLGAGLHNLYGPTEAAVDVSRWECRREGSGQRVPIGMPIWNVRMYVLDEEKEPVPVGVEGEIYIGGAGLARGYEGRAELTAERFEADKHSRAGGERAYRTGDIGRRRESGEIEYIGRKDGQVKVRGNRVELGEIESELMKAGGVREAAVVARESAEGDVRLAAYVVPSQSAAKAGEASGDAGHRDGPDLGESNLISALRRALRERLPEYMVPSAFIILDALPLLPNGKVNRQALPVIDANRQGMGVLYEPPRNEVEQAIAAVWQELLGVDKVGANDNFFDLGGHSLLMTSMRSRLQGVFRRDISMVDLFRNPTVGSLASYLSEGQEAAAFLQQPFMRAQAGAEPLGPQSLNIAIVGMAGRFPGAKNLDEFWRNLRDGVESVTFFSEDELAEAGVDLSVMRNPNFVNAGAVLDEIEMFDAAFFGFNPREAEVMDPQHRIFLECAWEALENAGYDSESYRRPVGVFAGTSLSSYLFNLYPMRDRLEGVWGFQTLLGNDKDFLPTRASYKLNLKGPSLTVQTACSTSLVAVHLACQSLLNGECDMAMAGGVSASHLHRAGYFYQESGPLSPDGHCRAFDARAKGTVFGSGVGIVILKRLADAIADGDNVLAVIKGTAINNDGSFKVGYTAPSVSGQAEVIARAQAVAGVDPETITYIETHGTGTELGDPIEVAALTEVFKKSTARKGFCAIGSVKTNIGHLDAAAGVTGLIKTVLALQNKALPPSLNFETANPGIDFDNTPFYVNARLQEWQGGEMPLRAAVSSFGIGGTNAHVILEEAPARAEEAESRPKQLLLISAKTGSALEAATLNLADCLRRNPNLNLADVAYTLQVGRRAFKQTRAIVCQDAEEAINLLVTPDRKRVFDGVRDGPGRSILFMFPGGGSQYPNMALELYQAEPIFRANIDLCSELLKQHVDYDLRRFIYPDAEELGEASARLARVSVALPALFVTEYSLAKLLMAWGIQPRAMIGHSLGEYVAACLAGVISLEDALAVVALRGRLLEGLPAGAMLSVALPEEQVRQLLSERLYLAAVNAPSLCVVSGSVEDIAEFERQLLDRGLESHRLRVSAAGHSEKVAPILGEFTAFLKTLRLQAPKIPYISNVTGTWIKAGEAIAPDYWADHLRSTVRFASGLKTLLEQESNTILLEVGPGQTLCTLTRQCVEKQSDHIALSSVRHPDDNDSDEAFLLKTLARLWTAGVDVDWPSFYGDEKRKRVPLPTYPYERKRYWIDHRQVSDSVAGRRAPVGARDVADRLYASLWKQSVAPGDPEAISDARAPKTWLVFVDECGIGARAAQRLRGLGQNVVEVRAGERFARIRDGLFSIAPGRREDYSALFEELRSAGQAPQTILHLWNVSEDRAGVEDESIDELQYSALFSLLFIVQAMGEKNLACLAGGSSSAEPIHIEVASNNAQAVTGDEAVRPEKALSLGICRVISHEYSNITCRSVDISIPEAGSRKEERLIANLIAEAMAGATDSSAAYRGIHRWVPSFEPVQSSEKADSTKRLRQGGVYLITGGLGNLGLEIAHYLASSVKAKLALADCSACVERDEQGLWQAVDSHGDAPGRAEKLRQIEELGAEVLLLRADVTDPRQMRRAAEQARERFGEVNGVIHAAGTIGGGLIEMQTPDALAKFLAPRVRGAQVVDALFGDAELDFILLCSSKSSAIGGLGLTDYCAADAFLHAFAHLSNSTKGRFAVAVGWDDWSVGEYQAAASSAGQPEPGVEATTYQQAGRVISRALSGELAHVVVSTKDLNALIEQSRAAGPSNAREEEAAGDAPEKAHERPDLRNSYIAPRNDVEQTIADIWQRLLGIERVGIEDNFFELGGHSLVAINVMSQLRESFRVELRMASLFNSPTVAGLAETIQKAMSESAGSAEPSIGLVSRDGYRVKASRVEAGIDATPKNRG